MLSSEVITSSGMATMRLRNEVRFSIVVLEKGKAGISEAVDDELEEVFDDEMAAAELS